MGPLFSWLNSNPAAFGMWSGVGIHETAQVIAAASQVDGASAIAISSKFIRIFMIGPMVFISLFIFRKFAHTSKGVKVPYTIPWFAVVFIIFTLIHLGLENSTIQPQFSSFNADYLIPGVNFLLAWSFAGIGLKVKISAIKAVGMKAFLGGLTVAVFAGLTSLLLVKFIWLQSL